ncbi:type II toxin-antitoxin system VapC family toxin [Chloroflexota bacterium]
MYTLDASVHVSALNPLEPESGACQALLRLIHQRQIPLYCPTLLPVEVAAAIARTMDDADGAVALAALVRGWPNQTLVPLEGAVVDAAIDLAARLRLRGADAVYAAVAQQVGTTLITLDRQQLERLPPEVRTARPADVLGEIETGR